MTEQPSTLYAKLLGQTAAITWEELQPFFARGTLLWVDAPHDLIEIAQALVENKQDKVAQWLSQNALSKLDDERASDLQARDPALWAVVVAPWVLAQEGVRGAQAH